MVDMGLHFFEAIIFLLTRSKALANMLAAHEPAAVLRASSDLTFEPSMSRSSGSAVGISPALHSLSSSLQA